MIDVLQYSSVILLSIAVICLLVISFLDWRYAKGLEKRIAELEYKNKHKVFTGSAPVSKFSKLS
jgi:uncharacterized protein involved in outer membrane biogenesis